MPQSPAPPFSCRYSPQLPELLEALQATVALSTYQAGKLVLFSAKDSDSLVQLPRSFRKAMGVAEDPASDRLAIACQDQILVFRNSAELAEHYPKSPGTYDALYMPRAAYFTGPLDVHDVHFGADGELYAVNTLFSCIMRVDDRSSFTPVWKPPFIDAIRGEDRCHLNGLAMEEGRPRYASAFNQGNTRQSWREDIANTGVIMDMDSNEVVAQGLAMPHSPQLIDGELYALTSANGQLVHIDRATGVTRTVVDFGGFVRGMSTCGDYLFVGLSKLRKKSKTFGAIAAQLPNNRAGVMVVHLPTMSKVGVLEYQSSVEEIYDVHILNGKRRPNILGPDDEMHSDGVTTPDSTFWRKPSPQD